MLSQQYVQVGVYSRDSSGLQSARKGLEPSLRLPFMCIFTPQCFVRVARPEIENRHRALGDSDFGDESAVLPANWFVKR